MLQSCYHCFDLDSVHCYSVLHCYSVTKCVLQKNLLSIYALYRQNWRLAERFHSSIAPLYYLHVSFFIVLIICHVMRKMKAWTAWAYAPLLFAFLGMIFCKIVLGYEGCSNMNASSFITFFTYRLQQNGNVSIKVYMSPLHWRQI